MSAERYARVMAKGVVLMDGAIGGELRNRCTCQDSTALIPASILFEEPECVRQLHIDYISEGASVLTTNTYATVRTRMEQLLGNGSGWEAAMNAALQLAADARAAAGNDDVIILGTLPPLHGSYNAEGVGDAATLSKTYAEHVALMQDHVDAFLCETMTSGAEARACLIEAKKSGKPVWVSWTLQEADQARYNSHPQFN